MDTAIRPARRGLFPTERSPLCGHRTPALSAQRLRAGTTAFQPAAGRSPRTLLSPSPSLFLSLAPGIALALLFTACGDGGGASTSPAPPPPPLPLSWNDVPSEITVRVGEEETFTALLSAAVEATYSITADSEAVEVSGKTLRAGVFEGTVSGVEAGEVTVTLTANSPGYATARATTGVVVEDLFDTNLWRELVFDAYDCPNGSSDELCMSRWGERVVEQRITAVLRGQPNLHLSVNDRDWPWDLSSYQQDIVRDAIRNSVRQVTGESFTGRITAGPEIRDQAGWVDIVPVGDEFFGGSGPCGVAIVGEPAGLILINVDSLGYCDLASVAVHEVGHALGFFHVLDIGDYIMSPHLSAIPAEFSEAERFHTELAWELGRGLPFTPDPRKSASSARMTTGAFSPGRTKKTLGAALASGEMTVCRAN